MKHRLMEFWIAVSSDPKKLGILGVLIVVALGLWARAALTESGPKPAKAQQPATSSAPAPSSSESSGKAGPTQVVTLPPMAPLSRNLCKPGQGLLPQPSQTEVEAHGARKPSPSNDDKPMDLEQLRVARIQEQASGLRLRSTSVGSNPIAVSQESGRSATGGVVRLGNEIAGFTLVKVDNGRVVLERDAVRVELAQQKP